MPMEHGFLQALETVIKFRLLLSIQLPQELKLFYDFIMGCIMKKKPASDLSKKFINTLESIQVLQTNLNVSESAEFMETEEP